MSPRLKKTILIVSGVFLVTLLLSLLTTLLMPGKPEETRYPETTLRKFLARVEAGQISSVRVYRQTAAPDFVALSGLWGGFSGQPVLIIARGRVSEAEQARITAGDFRQVLLKASETPETRMAPPTPPPDFPDALTSIRTVAMTTCLLSLLYLIILLVQRAATLATGGTVGDDLKPRRTSINLADVEGCDEAKQEVAEIVEYLKDPQRFKDSGGLMPKGILLVGPPGCGKTLLAKAVANEAKAKFYGRDGSSFVEMYVGVGSRRVRDLFAVARKNAPSVIFIDEIDSLAARRTGGGGGGGEREHNQTLNSLLVAMDGFDDNSGVVVMAATNKPEILDGAVLRPGRFDRKVYFDLPDLNGRLQILRLHASKPNRRYAEDVDFNQIAADSAGFSGADLANLLNEGCLHAARDHRVITCRADLDSARDKISWGRERKRLMTPADRKLVAYHEAGHALLHIVFGMEGYRLQKVTIIPRGRSLGSTHLSPERDLLNFTTQQISARLRCLMAGRVAEELVLGEITSGAASDIAETTKLARSMVLEWGMSDLGFASVGQGEQSLGSPSITAQAEQHILTLIENEYAATKALVMQHRGALDSIAGALLARETISGEEAHRLCAAAGAVPPRPVIGVPAGALRA